MTILRSTIMRNGCFSLSITLILLLGCTSIKMNHYQDGKSMGKGKGDIGIGLGLGISYDTQPTKIGESTYQIETNRGAANVFGSISACGGVTSHLDLGGDIFSAFGSTGFRLFGKYAFLDSLSPWGIALMPTFGFVFPWVSVGHEEFDLEDNEVRINYYAIFWEALLPISYRASKEIEFSLNLKYYFFHTFLRKEGAEDIDLKRTGESLFIYPGASLGVDFKKVKFEGTVIRTDNDEWLPFVGVCIPISKILSIFIDVPDSLLKDNRLP